MVIALIEWLGPDVVCLQELWAASDPAALDLPLPYAQLFCGGPRPRGCGQATLIHRRYSLAPGTGILFMLRLCKWFWPRALFSVINAHIRPGISQDDWVLLRSFVTDLIFSLPPTLLLLCGDLKS